jgi:hypothetical protein
MAKIDINKVAEVIKRNEVEPATLRQIIEELNLLTNKDEKDEEKEPAVKKQFAILISDPENKLDKKDLVGWIFQIPENESVLTTLDRLENSAIEFNQTKKGRLMPVKTVGEAIEVMPAKITKAQNIWIKTKTPVLVMTTKNEKLIKN